MFASRYRSAATPIDTRRWILPALLGLVLSLPGPAPGQPISPREGPLPPAMRDYLRAHPQAFTFKRSLIAKTERLRENRRMLREGRLDVAGKTDAEIRQMTVVSGTVYVPVLLAKYVDTGADPYLSSELQKELFDGPWPTGTMSAYYDEISYGNLDVRGTVYDWVTVSQDDAFYSADASCGRWEGAQTDVFITETIDGNDGAVDFGLYDNDGPDGIPNSGDDDGYVDFIAIVQPEIGGECGGCESNHNIWSHRKSLSDWPSGAYTTNDPSASGGNVIIDDYVIMPASSCTAGMIEIGVFCHEFGHAFGLPDLYDWYSEDGPPTCSTGDSEGVGWWDLMGAGNWNSPARPAHMSAWSKSQLGWVTPGVVAFDLNNWPVQSASMFPSAYKLWTGGNPSTEYFLVEYRTATGFDDQIEAPGLLIWHVDENTSNNTNECHKFLDLECEDQSGADHVLDADDLDSNTNRGDAGDPFCNGDSFGGATSPSSDSYDGSNTSVVVTDIVGCGGSTVRVDLRVGQDPADVDLCMRDCGSDPCTEPSPCDVFWASPEVYIDNNEDGVIDPPAEGIENKLFARVRNVGGDDATDVDVSFYFADPTLGLLFPSTGDLIDTDNVPLIGPATSEVAEVLWDIPLPPPDISHYCLGVIAENALDAQTDEYAPDDDNVVQINIQELYAKAGDEVPPAPGRHGAPFDEARTAVVPFQTTQRVMVCNPLHTTCNFSIKIGSPPLFDDAIIPSDWTVSLEYTQVPLGPFQCRPLRVAVKDAHAVHGDRCVVPLTLLCGGEAVGGTILVFEIDNVKPTRPCADFKVVRSTGSGDHFPGERTIHISWSDDFADALGFPERVERWRIYNGTSSAFVPSHANLIAETCIDEDPTTALYDHFKRAPADPAYRWYKIVAVDRAGNASDVCTTEEVVPTVAIGEAAAPPPTLALEVGNPFRVGSEVRFQLDAAGPGTVSIFSLTGRRVRDLATGELEAGEHHLRWDGTDATGREAASGVYVMRLVANERQVSKRFLLLR